MKKLIILLSVLMLSCGDGVRESESSRYGSTGYTNCDMVVMMVSKYNNTDGIYEYNIADLSASREWTLISTSVFHVGDTIQIVKK